tara:strand:+ start:111 stop:1328 length:1218 start_codon:yes stop_codon:yes gene_type:complete
LYSQCENNGDLDGDGEIEIYELSSLNNMVLNEEYSYIGDADNDSLLTVNDLILIYEWWQYDNNPCVIRFILPNYIFSTFDKRNDYFIQDLNNDYLIWEESLVRLNQYGDTLSVVYSNESEIINSLIITDSSNYVITGNTNSQSSTVLYVKKIDILGNEIWNYTKIEDPNAYSINGLKIIQNQDGTFTVLGHHEFSQAGYNDKLILIKLDQNGNELWYNEYISGQQYADWETKDFIKDTVSNNYIAVSDQGHILIKIIDDDGVLLTTFDTYSLGINGGDVKKVFLLENYIYVHFLNYLVKFDGNLNYQSLFSLVDNGSFVNVELDNDQFSVSSSTVNEGPLQGDYTFDIVNADGENIYNYTFVYPQSQLPKDHIKTNDGGYLLYIVGLGLIKTDSSGQIPYWLLED